MALWPSTFDAQQRSLACRVQLQWKRFRGSTVMGSCGLSGCENRLTSAAVPHLLPHLGDHWYYSRGAAQSMGRFETFRAPYSPLVVIYPAGDGLTLGSSAWSRTPVELDIDSFLAMKNDHHSTTILWGILLPLCSYRSSSRLSPSHF